MVTELMFVVLVVFIVAPVCIAVWDEYRWHRAGQHRVRKHEQLFTYGKDRG